MLRSTLFAPATAFLVLSSPLTAQSTSGLFVGAQVTGAAFDFTNAALKLNFGGGWGVHAGYGFGERWSLVANYDKTSLGATDGSGNYDLGQWDALARLSLVQRRSMFRPYLDAGFTGRVAKSSTFSGSSADYTFSGGSLTGGFGAQFFVGRAVAIDGGVNWTFRNCSTTQSNGTNVGTRVDANGTRVMVGASVYPFAR